MDPGVALRTCPGGGQYGAGRREGRNQGQRSHGSPDFQGSSPGFLEPLPWQNISSGEQWSRDPSGPVWVMPDTHPSSSAVLAACLPGDLTVADGLCRELVSSLDPGGQVGQSWCSFCRLPSAPS